MHVLSKKKKKMVTNFGSPLQSKELAALFFFHCLVLAFLGQLKIFAPENHDLSSPSSATSPRDQPPAVTRSAAAG